jgi:glucose/mannose transport system permease protein
MTALIQPTKQAAVAPFPIGRVLNRVAIYLALFIMLVFILIPVYLVVVTSFKTPEEMNLLAVWRLPQNFGRENLKSFSEAFTTLLPYLINSMVLTVPATLISAMLGSLNGYVLSKWRFRGANIIFPLMLFGMFIPYQSILIPLFQTLKSLNLFGGLAGLTLAHIVYGLPITTLIFRNYYAEVPDEMIEAGQIDGADFFGIYSNILFPLSLPGFVVVIIWQFTQIWNEYLFAVTLTSRESWPITVALSQLGAGQAINYNVQMAGSFLTAVPTLLVYIFLGRYFIRGLLAGSVKG